MPKPTHRQVHVDKPLTNMAVAWFGDNMGVSERMFPMIPVNKQSDKYFEYDLGDLTRIEPVRVAPGAIAPSSGFDIDSAANYHADVYKLRHPIPDETRDNADEPLDLERAAVMYLSQQHRKRQEKLWAANAWTSGVWGTDLDGATSDFVQWDAAGSDPILDIHKAADNILLQTGFKPNKMAFGVDAWRVFKNHSTVIDRIKHTQTGVITEQIAAGLLGLDEVMVAGEMETTSAEGAATRTAGFIADPESALLVHVTSAPSIWVPSAGYNFAWRGLARNAEGILVKQYYIDERNSDFVEQHVARDPKVVAPDLGTFLFDILT